MRHLKIEHVTRYAYNEVVELMPHRLFVRSREGQDIHIESSKLAITPANTINRRRDTYGNSVAIVSFKEPGSSLSIVSEVVIQHYETTPLTFV